MFISLHAPESCVIYRSTREFTRLSHISLWMTCVQTYRYSLRPRFHTHSCHTTIMTFYRHGLMFPMKTGVVSTFGMNTQLINRRVAFVVRSPKSLVCVPLLRLKSAHRNVHTGARRSISQTSRTSNTATLASPVPQTTKHDTQSRPLARISSVSLLRSLLLGYCFSSPRLLKSSIQLMSVVVHSKWAILHPNKSPIVAAILRAFIYDHFCAGTNPAAVQASIEKTKSLGYSGIILGFSREIMAEDVVGSSATEVESKSIQSWKDANLCSLKLIGRGDHTNLK